MAGAVVLAPHTMVEQMSIDGIRCTREAYQHGALRRRLSRYHDDVDSAFYGWCDAWLAPDFRAWNIEDEIAAIACPVLGMQGLQDEYATMAHLHAIAQRVPRTRVLEIDHCGHSPHQDQPQVVIDACAAFLHARGPQGQHEQSW